MTPTPHPAPDPRRRGAARPAPSIPMLAYESLDDRALLAMVLSRSGGEPDRRAGELLARFGSLGAVAAADLSELTRASDAGPAAFADLKVLRELAVRLARVDACRRPAIASWTALQAYVRTAMAHRPREQFRVLYLDHRNNLLRDEWVAEGTVDHAPVYNSGPARVASLGRIPRIRETEQYVESVVECFLALSAGRVVSSARQCRREGPP